MASATNLQRTVLEEVLDGVACIEPRPYFVLRLHPKDRFEDYAAYQHEVDEISQGGPSLDLAYCSDLVIGMTTMLLLESVILGRGTLSVLADRSQADWLPTVRFGLTTCVSERTDLGPALVRLLGNQKEPASIVVEEALPPGALMRSLQAITAIAESGREHQRD